MRNILNSGSYFFTHQFTDVTHKTPTEIIGEMVRERAMASAIAQ